MKPIVLYLAAGMAGALAEFLGLGLFTSFMLGLVAPGVVDQLYRRRDSSLQCPACGLEQAVDNPIQSGLTPSAAGAHLEHYYYVECSQCGHKIRLDQDRSPPLASA
jgi:predicted nucleic-acid-binding Zn-ribbon protein